MNREREEKETLSGFGTVNFERRKHPRIAVNLPVEYWKVNETRIRAGCTGDISEGGALLYLPEQMAVGRELRLRLFVDAGFDFLSVEALAQAVWKDLNSKNEGGCRVGVKFLDISSKDMCNLKNLLNRLAPLQVPSGPLQVPSGMDVPPKLLLDLGISVVKAEEASHWILMRD